MRRWKLFLAGILDLHDRGMAGWSMGERQTTDLVVNALVMALARRDPNSELIHHVDQLNPRNTRRSSSRTGSLIGTFDHRSARPVSAGTTPPWNQHGPPPNARSATSTATGPESRARNYARSCSTTSKPSTTEPATKPASNTKHPCLTERGNSIQLPPGSSGKGALVSSSS